MEFAADSELQSGIQGFGVVANAQLQVMVEVEYFKWRG